MKSLFPLLLLALAVGRLASSAGAQPSVDHGSFAASGADRRPRRRFGRS